MTFTIDLWQIGCFIGVIAFLLLVMWVERQTPAERAEEERKRRDLCKRQDRDIDLDGATRYSVFFEGSSCALGTDNYKLALDAFDRECKCSQKEVRLFDGGTLIKRREELK